jgi:hypothetical protein
MPTYRTYRGKTVEVDTINRQNENTVAVGNMRVNARGDTIGAGGEVIESADQKARKFVDTTKTTTQRVGLKPDIVEDIPLPVDKTDLVDDFVEEEQDNGDIEIKPKRGK